jgi:hypothetical protein
VSTGRGTAGLLRYSHTPGKLSGSCALSASPLQPLYSPHLATRDMGHPRSWPGKIKEMLFVTARVARFYDADSRKAEGACRDFEVAARCSTTWVTSLMVASRWRRISVRALAGLRREMAR